LKDASEASVSSSRYSEARRFARLLVSEIKLYNEAKIAEGRKKRDVYEKVKDDIERSLKVYNERVSAKLTAQRDFFYEELVATLAGGDPAALGKYPHKR